MNLLRQILLGAALLAALGGYLWLTHHQLAAAETRAITAEQSARDAKGELAANKASEHIVTVYVDRVQVVHEVGSTITKEIPVYVNAQADARCIVPLGFARVHDAAAAVLPAPPGSTDAQPSGLALSTVAGTIVDNYTTCHGTSAQLTALQDWVRANTAPGSKP
jgi:hypothetical protein